MFRDALVHGASVGIVGGKLVEPFELVAAQTYRIVFMIWKALFSSMIYAHAFHSSITRFVFVSIYKVCSLLSSSFRLSLHIKLDLIVSKYNIRIKSHL